VAPKQCPNCGRFLKNALVDALAEGPQPCPGCTEPLTSDQFDEEASVRPPDLTPAEVRDDASDVLEGWDRDADAAEIAAWDRDQPPFPTDAAVVAGSGLVGALLGAVATPRRVRGALIGGLLGVLVAAVARRIWQLPD
jgi:hypothetical protein